jgi:hypothetical protein
MQRKSSKPPAAATSPTRVTAEPAIAGLVDRARELDALDATLRAALPAVLASQVRLANMRESRLVFLASSSTVAARLRLAQDELLAYASRVTGQALTTLAVKVSPVPAVPPDGLPRKALSHAASAHLAGAATAITDPELKDLLRRLASLA